MAFFTSLPWRPVLYSKEMVLKGLRVRRTQLRWFWWGLAALAFCMARDSSWQTRFTLATETSMALSIPLASTVWTKSNNPTGVAQLTAHRIQPARHVSAAGVEIGDLHAGDFTSTSARVKVKAKTNPGDLTESNRCNYYSKILFTTISVFVAHTAWSWLACFFLISARGFWLVETEA